MKVPFQISPETGNTAVAMPVLSQRHHAVIRRGAQCSAPAACSRRGLGRRGQAGFSLIEVLLSIAIIAVVVMGVLAGFFTTVTASGGVGRRAGADAVLATMTERVASIPYRNLSLIHI